MAAFDDLFSASATPEIQRVFGDSVTYRRGSSELSITAVFSPHEAELQLSSGVIVAFRGYLVDVELSSLATLSPAEPSRGDEIERVIGGVTQTLRVTHPDDRPPFDVDPGNKTFSIFATLDNQES
jgi:hypothetical protein